MQDTRQRQVIPLRCQVDTTMMQEVMSEAVEDITDIEGTTFVIDCAYVRAFTPGGVESLGQWVCRLHEHGALLRLRNCPEELLVQMMAAYLRLMLTTGSVSRVQIVETVNWLDHFLTKHCEAAEPTEAPKA